MDPSAVFTAPKGVGGGWGGEQELLCMRSCAWAYVRSHVLPNVLIVVSSDPPPG